MTRLLRLLPGLHNVADESARAARHRRPANAAMFGVSRSSPGACARSCSGRSCFGASSSTSAGPRRRGRAERRVRARALPQGWDAVITTGVLGAFWAVVYLRRRSSVAPIVSHAGFNSLEVLRVALTGS